MHLATKSNLRNQRRRPHELSNFLRHKPPCAIDESGWVKVADILPHLGYTHAEQLFQKVAEDNKSRFELDAQRDKIRACHGHSIRLGKPILRPILATDVPMVRPLHATTEEAWKLIQTSGYLKPMSRTHVHFSSIEHKLRDRPVLLELEATRALKQGIGLFHSSSEGVILADKPVPVDLLRRT